MSEPNTPRPFPGLGHGSTPPLPCPRCGSPYIHDKNYGSRLGGVIGICTGVMQSLSGMSKGAYLGATAAYHLPTSNPVSCLTTAVLGALVGGAAGCITGAALGQAIDQFLLNNHRCLRCGYSFQSL